MAAPPGRAAAVLREAELVALLVHPDADSVLAAGILGAALHRAGVPWHARPCAALEKDVLAALAEEAPGQPAVLLGLGGRDGAALDALGGEAVVLDARWPRAVGKRALLVEDPMPGATAATLALDLARGLDARPAALPALAGLAAVGPADGAEGLGARLAEEAAPQGGAPGPVPALGQGPLVEALAGSTEPFLPGLSGRARASKKWLEGFGLPAEAAADDLPPEAAARLTEALTLHLLAKGASALAPRLLLTADVRGPVPGGSARGLARMCAAACAAGRAGLALALALGDPRGAADAAALAEARQQRLLQALLKLEGDPGAAGPLRAEPDLAADLAWGCALSLRGGEPVAVLAGAGELHVAAPALEPRFLGHAAAEAGRHAGGLGSSLGHRAVVTVPAGQAPAAWEHLRRQLGVVA